MSDGREFFSVVVPVPMIDEVLPRLRDTELRVLLVVLRQLSVVGKERERAWLTHGQLRLRTGRASEAVSAAIAGLVSRGLLEVENEEGKLLAGASARQNAMGRHYYRIPRWKIHQSGSEKTKTIEVNNHYSLRFSEPEEGTTGDIALRIEEEKRKIRNLLSNMLTRRRSGNSYTN